MFQPRRLFSRITVAAAAFAVAPMLVSAGSAAAQPLNPPSVSESVRESAVDVNYPGYGRGYYGYQNYPRGYNRYRYRNYPRGYNRYRSPYCGTGSSARPMLLPPGVAIYLPLTGSAC